MTFIADLAEVGAQTCRRIEVENSLAAGSCRADLVFPAEAYEAPPPPVPACSTESRAALAAAVPGRRRLTAASLRFVFIISAPTGLIGEEVVQKIEEQTGSAEAASDFLGAPGLASGPPAISVSVCDPASDPCCGVDRGACRQGIAPTPAYSGVVWSIAAGLGSICIFGAVAGAGLLKRLKRLGRHQGIGKREDRLSTLTSADLAQICVLEPTVSELARRMRAESRLLWADRASDVVCVDLTDGTASEDAFNRFANVGVRDLVFGRPAEAALGICHYMCVDESTLGARIACGVSAIVDEVTTCDLECLQYVLDAEAGSSDRGFQGGLRRDCDEEGEVLACRLVPDGKGGQRGMTIDDFVAHPSARQSLLTKAHVVALRLYTTAAFRSINDPLRDRDRYENKLPHKLPVTVALLRDALGKLRAVEANQGSTGGGDDEGAFASPRVSPRELHLYRGMKDVRAPLEFLAQGGTELAPMSTTSSLAVAMKYSASRNAVLLRLVTDSFISRGPDISFLSDFPAEREFLFPPLTYLAPTGNVEKIAVGGASWDVIDVKPHL